MCSSCTCMYMYCVLSSSSLVMLLSPTLLSHIMRECHAHQTPHFVLHTRAETQYLTFGPDKLFKSYVNTSKGKIIFYCACMCDVHLLTFN